MILEQAFIGETAGWAQLSDQGIVLLAALSPACAKLIKSYI
ncbi:hypothetical protein [Paenibacillus durus]|nr:hypothetical protein [Paenibacillus durus]